MTYLTTIFEKKNFRQIQLKKPHVDRTFRSVVIHTSLDPFESQKFPKKYRARVNFHLYHHSKNIPQIKHLDYYTP